MSEQKFKELNFIHRSNSGNNIFLHEKDGRLIVRKIIEKPTSRDFLSLEKQINFTNYKLSKKIYTCKINKLSNNPLSYEMKYIFGFVGEKIIKELNPYSIISLARNIDRYLNVIFENAVVKNLDVDIFISKLNDIKDLTINKDLKKDIEKITYVVKENLLGETKIEIPIGFCHGDFTFSNMIVGDNGELCLIDFLHTFCESPLQDYAKLNQELKYGWSLRYESKYSKTKSKIAFSKIQTMIKILDILEKRWPKQCKLFEILCLSRIAPYCENTVVIKWLRNSIKVALDREYGFIDSNGR